MNVIQTLFFELAVTSKSCHGMISLSVHDSHEYSIQISHFVYILFDFICLDPNTWHWPRNSRLLPHPSSRCLLDRIYSRVLLKSLQNLARLFQPITAFLLSIFKKYLLLCKIHIFHHRMKKIKIILHHPESTVTKVKVLLSAVMV